jgi:hypothetical protein
LTPAQLSHLAEQADFAAGYYSVTNPSAARRFKEAAATAQQLSAQLERQQQIARLRVELADIRGRLDRRERARQSPAPFGSPSLDSPTLTVGRGIDV